MRVFRCPQISSSLPIERILSAVTFAHPTGKAHFFMRDYLAHLTRWITLPHPYTQIVEEPVFRETDQWPIAAIVLPKRRSSTAIGCIWFVMQMAARLISR